MANPKVQQGVVTVTTGIGLAAVLNVISSILGIIALLAGILVSISIYRKNKSEQRKFDAQSEILESKEKARRSAVEERHLKGEPCRRCTDDEVEVEKHEGH
jgi:hypothetical protein